MLPLPLGEGWDEGIFAFTSKASNHPALRAMTNLLIQHRFPLTPSSQLAKLPLKIAKRQSISRESTMATIVAISQVKAVGGGLGAEIQGR